MIVRTRHGGDVQLRATAQFGSSAIPLPGAGFSTFSGKNVGLDQAAGLPAVGSVIRQICSTVAMCDLDVYKKAVGDGPEEKVENSWQDELFDNPSLDDSEFDFLSELSAGIEGFGNAFYLKTKNRGRVLELRPLSADWVRIRRSKGEKVFDVRLPDDNGQVGREFRDLTTSDILHIPGFRWPSLLSGLSPVQMHRQALGTALAIEEYAGRFFANDASVNFAIKVPGKINRIQAKELLDVWESTHGGLANAHRPGLLANGAEMQQLGMSMKDAQYVEAEVRTVAQVAQIWNWPADLLGGGDTATTERLSVEQLGLRLITFSLAFRLKRIEKALVADLDLFPLKQGLCPRFSTAKLVNLDATTLATVVHGRIQDGTLSRNEARAKFGEPGIGPEGDSYQTTPVGGAPNEFAPPPADPTGTLEKPDGRSLAAPPEVIVVPIEIHTQSPSAPDVHVDVKVPRQSPPVVNVDVPRQPPPVVNMPAQLPPVVRLPARSVRSVSKRLPDGSIETIYEDPKDGEND